LPEYSIDTSSLVFLTTNVIPGVCTVGLTGFRTVVYNQWDKVSEVVKGPALRDGDQLVGDYLAEQEKNPKRAAAIARARARAAAVQEREAGSSLATLRLKAGLSQTQLATAMGTQQPNVARWERNPGNIEFATMKKLAAALGLATEDVLRVLEQPK
jgi:DNA-binding transcriptional regulator YiaG